MYISRALEPVLARAARQFPAVVLTGPRQSGKTTGVEVDLVVDTGAALIPIETKLSATPRPAMAESILKFRRDVGKAIGPGFVVHPGQVTLPLAPGVTALPFAAL